MDCKDATELLELAIDGELDARSEAALEEHVSACSACSARRDRLSVGSAAIRAIATYHQAPTALRQNIASDLASASATPATARPRRGEGQSPHSVLGWRVFAGAGWMATACTLLALTLVLQDRHSAAQLLADELLANHARAVVTQHLVDVASSDQHTVKPWFSGKLDFSPPVRDLSEEGFPLLGGRLDYLDHRPVAVLVYRRRQHLIDVFISPVEESSTAIPSHSLRGLNIVAWTESSMSFRAVSDVDPADLARLARLL